MKISHLLLFAAGVPLLAFAQAQQSMPSAADANAPVTPLQYQSVFAGYVTTKEPPQSPDKSWLAGNRAVLGDEAVTSASARTPVAGASEKGSESKPADAKHQHEGAHR